MTPASKRTYKSTYKEKQLFKSCIQCDIKGLREVLSSTAECNIRWHFCNTASFYSNSSRLREISFTSRKRPFSWLRFLFPTDCVLPSPKPWQHLVISWFRFSARCSPCDTTALIMLIGEQTRGDRYLTWVLIDHLYTDLRNQYQLPTNFLLVIFMAFDGWFFCVGLGPP